jgi:hypothetical protein
MSSFQFQFKKDREMLYQNLDRFIRDYIDQKAETSGPDYITYRNIMVTLERLIKELQK